MTAKILHFNHQFTGDVRMTIVEPEEKIDPVAYDIWLYQRALQELMRLPRQELQPFKLDLMRAAGALQALVAELI